MLCGRKTRDNPSVKIRLLVVAETIIDRFPEWINTTDDDGLLRDFDKSSMSVRVGSAMRCIKYTKPIGVQLVSAEAQPCIRPQLVTFKPCTRLEEMFAYLCHLSSIKDDHGEDRLMSYVQKPYTTDRMMQLFRGGACDDPRFGKQRPHRLTDDVISEGHYEVIHRSKGDIGCNCRYCELELHVPTNGMV